MLSILRVDGEEAAVAVGAVRRRRGGGVEVPGVTSTAAVVVIAMALG